MIMHDRLFKEFFRRFLERFMWLFYPVKAARLDWSRLQFIVQEQIVNFPGQALRITDVAARVPVNEADTPAFLSSVDDNIDKREPKTDDEKPPEQKEEVILVHIDVEANKPKPVPNRMFEYYSLYRVTQDKPVLPIALIMKGRSYKKESEPETDSDKSQMRTYTEHLWDEPLLTFRYYEIVLEDLMSEEYLDKNDPVAAALAVLMRHPKKLSALIKKRSLDIITQDDELSIEDKQCLVHFVEEYKPDDQVQGGTEEIMKQLAEYKLTWGERHIVTGRQDMLIDMLKDEFQEIADEVIERIRAIEDSDILRKIGRQLRWIQSPDELVWPEPA